MGECDEWRGRTHLVVDTFTPTGQVYKYSKTCTYICTLYKCMYVQYLSTDPTNTHTEWVSVQEMFVNCCYTYRNALYQCTGAHQLLR